MASVQTFVNEFRQAVDDMCEGFERAGNLANMAAVMGWVEADYDTLGGSVTGAEVVAAVSAISTLAGQYAGSANALAKMRP